MASSGNPIGYIIHEEVCLEVPPPKIIKTDSDEKIIIEATLQDADNQNRNGRIYAKKDLWNALQDERMKELMKYRSLKGEAGHPQDKALGRQQTIDPTNTCCVYLKIWTDGDLIKSWVKGTNNELGKEFDLDVKDGEIKQFSLRALGSLQSAGGKTYVKNLRIITWDNVIFPSHKVAHMTGIVGEKETNKTMTESAILPIYTPEAVKYVREQSKNLKSVFESFDICGSKISLLNENSASVVTPDGDTMVVGLETYIANEIMNYGLK